MKPRSAAPKSQAERWGYADVYVDEELSRQPLQEGFSLKTVVAAFFLDSDGSREKSVDDHGPARQAEASNQSEYGDDHDCERDLRRP